MDEKYVPEVGERRRRSRDRRQWIEHRTCPRFVSEASSQPNSTHSPSTFSISNSLILTLAVLKQIKLRDFYFSSGVDPINKENTESAHTDKEEWKWRREKGARPSFGLPRMRSKKAARYVMADACGRSSSTHNAAMVAMASGSRERFNWIGNFQMN